jgi:hypothetical protein
VTERLKFRTLPILPQRKRRLTKLELKEEEEKTVSKLVLQWECDTNAFKLRDEGHGQADTQLASKTFIRLVSESSVRSSTNLTASTSDHTIVVRE